MQKQTSSVSVVHSGDTVTLSGALNFDSAPEVLAKVSALIRQQKSLTIDLSESKGSNSAGLALLIEWQAEAKRAGHSVTFSQLPNSLIQLSHVCQVNSLI